MREIKFRAWNKKTKCMFQVTEMNFRSNGVVYSVSPNQGENWFLVGDDVELTQYTGLKDVNGKEIYEGDIVKYRDNNLFIIEYVTEKTMFRAVYIIKKDRDIFDDRLIGNRCEVIGNIFENKELLLEVEDEKLQKNNKLFKR